MIQDKSLELHLVYSFILLVEILIPLALYHPSLYTRFDVLRTFSWFCLRRCHRRIMFPSFISFMQALGGSYYIIGILGTLIPYYVPSISSVSHYGRLFNSSRNDLKNSTLDRLVAFVNSISVPKSYFSFFYLFGLVINAYAIYNSHIRRDRLVDLIVLGLYGVHLLRRVYECFFVHKFSEARMPLTLFAVGCAHYLFVPFTLISTCEGPLGIFELILAPGIVSLRLLRSFIPGVDEMVVLNAFFAAVKFSILMGMGLVMFSAGSYIQYTAHVALASLRDSNSNDSAYVAGKGHFGASVPSLDTFSQHKRNEDILQDNVPHASFNSSENDFQRKRLGANTNSSGFSSTGFDSNGGQFEIVMGDEYSGEVSTQSSSSLSSNKSFSDDDILRKKYPAPRGPVFEISLSPHYTGEILIYLGLISLSDGLFALFSTFRPAHYAKCNESSTLFISIAPTLMILWIICNLSVTAIRNKKWYIENYPNITRMKYVAAIIPYVL